MAHTAKAPLITLLSTMRRPYFMTLMGRRVVEGQPWHFDHCLMVFANPEGLNILQPDQLRFVPFWVQIHSIPFEFRSPHLAQFVAKDLGDLIEIHKATLLEISGPFLRIRVLLDITKPIRRGRMPPALPFKDNIRALPKSFFKRDLFDMSNSIPLEEMNLRSSQHNQDLQEVVNQFLPPGNFSETQGQVDVQPRIDIPNTTSSILTSVGQSVVSSTPVSNFQSLLCAVSRVMMSDALVIVHMDKEKGVQLPATSIPITSVPIFQPRPLTIGGNSCTKRSYTRQDMPSSTSVRSFLKKACVGDSDVVVPNVEEDHVVPAGVAEQPRPEK
uniref:DUF4283 domain-containing protein n=1 Tax=Cannabis sativa TaxID=3483 RepID=A0A803NL06_CANSA